VGSLETEVVPISLAGDASPIVGDASVSEAIVVEREVMGTVRSEDDQLYLATADGASIAFADEGSGTPVLFVPGICCGRRWWDLQWPLAHWLGNID
jgi:hypothetical protein